MIIFILGIIFGSVITILIGLVTIRFQTPLQRTVNTVLNHPLVTGSAQAYIAGLSDEEQSYRESLNADNRDTKIL